MATCSMEEGISKDKTETSVWTWASSLRNGCIQWPFPRRGVRVRRPDLAGAASMLASKITTLKAKDMQDINCSIAGAKATRDLELKFHPTPPADQSSGTVTDCDSLSPRLDQGRERTALDDLVEVWEAAATTEQHPGGRGSSSPMSTRRLNGAKDF